MHSPRWGVGGIVVSAAVTWLLASGIAIAQGKPAAGSPQSAAAQGAGYVGQDTCLTCHAELGKVYGATPHGRTQNPSAPAAQHGCESCHGPGKAHVDGGGDKTKIRRFTAISSEQGNEACTTCHNRRAQTDWSGSMHERRDLACTTCHGIHRFKSEAAQLKAATDVDTCSPCHRTEALKIRRVGHMPLREGKMGCASCHNPHGSSNVRLLRAGNSIAEACTSCHAAQRGPFLWPHAPVEEKCTTCHDPHGSSNDRMLIAKAPMLCQRCHVSTRHPSTVYDRSVIGAGSQNRLVNRGCVNCHQNIHGSNHPSGNYFLR